MNKSVLFALILVVIVVVLLSGFARRMSTQEKGVSQKIVKPSIAISSVPASSFFSEPLLPSGKVSDTDMSTWLTYTEATYRYSFRYPSQWQLSESATMKTVFLTVGTFPNKASKRKSEVPEWIDPQNTAIISFSDTGEKTASIEQLASQWRQGEPTRTQVSGREAAEIVESAEGITTVSIFVPNNAGTIHLIQLETANPSLFAPIFKSILSTVTFAQ